MFAKLFDRPAYGQVLAMLGADEDGRPEVRWYAQPPGLGVCSCALGFDDSDAGWECAERAFRDANESEADEAGKTLFAYAGARTNDTGEIILREGETA